MKVRMYVAAAGAAALAGTGAFLLPAAASSHVTPHTLKYVSVEKNSVGFSKTVFGVQDTDHNQAGKAVGFDELHFKGVSATTVDANVTADFSGGMLYGTFKLNLTTAAITNGKVTGGTGAFNGATGTIRIKSLNSAGTRHLVTVTYHT